MTLNIKDLLRRDTLTGDELGVVFLMDDVELILRRRNILSNEERNTLLDKIKTAKEINRFECYKTFHNWLHHNYYVIRSDYYHALYALSHIVHHLEKTTYAEEIAAQSIKNNQLKDIVNSLSIFFSYENNPIQMDDINSFTECLQKNLRSILIFNCSISLFSDYLDLPDLRDVFTFDIDLFDNNLFVFKNSVRYLKSILTGDKNEKSRKKKQLDIIFPIVGIETLKPDEEKLFKAIENVPDLFSRGEPHLITPILMGEI